MADFVDEMFGAPQAEEPSPVSVPEQPVEVPAEAPAPEPVAEPAPAPEPSSEPAEKREERTVPLGTFLDMRDRATAAERWKADQEARQRDREARPDPRDDPEGFAAHQTQQVEERLTQERFAMSDMFARQAHGAEAVEQAVQWAQQRASSDPSFAMAYMRERNPIDWIVQQHRRDALMADIGDPSKLDDWFAREAAKRGYQTPSAAPAVAVAPAPVAVAPVAKPAAPPRSLASDSGSGSASATDDTAAAFNAIFDKRVA